LINEQIVQPSEQNTQLFT